MLAQVGRFEPHLGPEVGCLRRPSRRDLDREHEHSLGRQQESEAIMSI